MSMARVLAALVGAAFLGHAGLALAGPQVRTLSGSVEGLAQPGLEVFLGVPYAAPPVGELRWKAPQPVEAWRGVRAATKLSPACLQDDPAPFGPYGAEFLTLPERSEDCLYLNVWAPARSARRRPVLVFIHGGAFQSGSTSVPIYDGADLARKGVVVVTLNYRLGVFGFLAHPELTRESPLATSGNYGLLDIIAALRWVRGNIARFGGDPERVTIAGQSAGAAAVNNLIVSPLANGLFHRAIAESGAALGIPMPSLAEAEKNGAAFAGRMKTASIAQLRALPAAEVFKGSKALPPFFGLPNLDGKVVPANPDIAASPVVSSAPLLTGYNRDEAAPPGAVSISSFVSDVKRRYGDFAERILAAYPHATDAEAAASAVELGRDRYLAGVILWAQQRQASQRQRVYLYHFDHAYPGADPERWGAFHTAEVPYVFGTVNLAGAAVTPEDRRVSEQVQAHWIAFVTSGDPSVPAAPWPHVAQAPGLAMSLGDSRGMAPPVSRERLELFRAYVAAGGRLSMF